MKITKLLYGGSCQGKLIEKNEENNEEKIISENAFLHIKNFPEFKKGESKKDKKDKNKNDKDEKEEKMDLENDEENDGQHQQQIQRAIPAHIGLQGKAAPPPFPPG